MPSDAYINFLHIREDVIKLIDTHTDYSKKTRGRKNLGHLTRSAVIMLCAAWERYNEDLLLETIKYLTKVISDVNDLNLEIKKVISSRVKNDKHELKPIQLAGDGWKNVWYAYAQLETEVLNTPKSNNLKLLFGNFLGIPDYTKLWKTRVPREIDDFVSDRGEIAHNGNKAKYITMGKLKRYQELIIQNVIEIDSKMADEIKVMTGQADLPWKKLYFRNLKNYR